jgi:hypothetical protein
MTLATRVCTLLGLALVSLAAEPTVETHEYREVTGRKESVFRWTLVTGDGLCRVQSASKEEQHEVVCDPNGITTLWTVKRLGTDISCKREGNTVFVRGTREGEPYEKQFKLGDVPWVQPLSLALRVQATHQRKERVFWMLRPDNLDMVKLRSTYEGADTVRLNGTDVAADRVRVSSVGALGAVWHSFYWFRRSDHVFLRYEGVMGLPFLPKTTVTLHAPRH